MLTPITKEQILGTLYNGNDTTQDSWATIALRHEADTNGDKIVDAKEAAALFKADKDNNGLTAPEISGLLTGFLSKTVKKHGWKDPISAYNIDIFQKAFDDIKSDIPTTLFTAKNEFKPTQDALYTYDANTHAFGMPIDWAITDKSMSSWGQIALQTTVLFPPYTSNALALQGSRDVYKNTSLSIIDANSKDPDYSAVMPGPDADAGTVLIGDKKTGKNTVAVVLFTDRIFRDENGQERPDGFSRLINALSHELYGNATSYLNRIKDGTQTEQDRVEMEITAFEAGIAYLERLIASPFYAGLPEKIKTDLKDALTRDRHGLATWQARRN